MENQATNQNESIAKNEIVIDSKSLSYLTETRKWTMFFAILGFIAIGFMLIAAVVLGFVGTLGAGFGGGKESMMFGAIGFVYIIIGLLYFFPIFYLLKFSTNMKTAIEQNTQNNLALAFENLKSHYRFLGILTIVILGLYVLIAIIAALVGISSLF